MIDFKGDGSIVLQFREGKVTLEPPTLGQLRVLRNLAVTFSEEMVNPDAQESFRNEWAVKWLGQAISDLAADQPTAEIDDWPAWTANGELPAKIVTHWLTYPLASLPQPTVPAVRGR